MDDTVTYTSTQAQDLLRDAGWTLARTPVVEVMNLHRGQILSKRPPGPDALQLWYWENRPWSQTNDGIPPHGTAEQLHDALRDALTSYHGHLLTVVIE